MLFQIQNHIVLNKRILRNVLLQLFEDYSNKGAIYLDDGSLWTYTVMLEDAHL